MRYTQPQSGPLRIDPENPLAISELFIPVSRRTVVRGYDTTVSAGVVSNIVGPPGRGIAFDVTANNGLIIASNPDLVFSSLSECTVFVFRRSKDTTARSSYFFGYDNNSTDRVLAHAPYSDGNLYWDFGGTGASNRISVPFAKSTLPETLVFVAGSVKGREVWRNGVKIVANAATTGLRPSNTTTPVRIGAAASGFTSDNEEIYLFGIAAKAWSDAEIKAWSANPWQLTKSPQRVMLAAAGPDVTLALTGQATTAAAGNLVPGTIAAVGGQSATAMQGNIAPVVATGLSGQSSSAQQGLLTPTRAITISGLSSASAVGTVGPGISSALTGQASTTQQGIVAPSGNITVALTGQSASVVQGALTRSAPEAVFALATIMRQSAIAVQAGTMKSTVAVQGGALKSTIALSTIMRQSQINTKATMTNASINRTVAFL